MNAIRATGVRFDVALPTVSTPRLRSGDVGCLQCPKTVGAASRRRHNRTPVAEAVFAMGCFAGLVLFTQHIVTRSEAASPSVDQDRSTPKPSTRKRSATTAGGDRPFGTRQLVPKAISLADVPLNETASLVAAAEPADAWCAAAVNACRQRNFDEADTVAQRARKASPKDPRPSAFRVLIAYSRQYPELAEEAIERIHRAGEIDFGPDQGVGVFVERQGDELVFQCRGRHVRLQIDQLRKNDGLRFRLTRDFLDRGQRPANDLILGAVHFVDSIDECGAYDDTGFHSKQAARDRWDRASRSEDQVVATQARSLLSLLDER